MAQRRPDELLYLGVGEWVIARLPTPSEQKLLGIGQRRPVIVLYHTDREPEVFPAEGLGIAPYLYGAVS